MHSPIRRIRILLIGLAIITFLSAGFITGQLKKNQKASVPTVKRARKPVFKERDWDTVFFKDIFKDGFVGNRPGELGQGLPRQVAGNNGGNAGGNTGNGNGNGGTDSSEFKWTNIIGRTVIEDEVKRLQIQLTNEVTTPTKYKSDHHKARVTFSMLAMLFTIIEKYDGDVRWKKHAPYARAAFARAAANARTGSEQAYQNAKRQMVNLEDMVRGGNFPQDEKIGEYTWADVADRGPIMTLLEDMYQKNLKPLTSSESEFKKNRDKVLHQASLIAALSVVLAGEEMDDADDEDYLVYTTAMRNGALQVVSGSKNENFPIVEKGVNAVGQSCTNCHDDWR